MPWKEIFEAAEIVGGVEYYLIEQEGSRFPALETAERCLAPGRRCTPERRAGREAYPTDTMVVAGRRKSIVLFIALGTGLILVTLLLYVGWVLLDWRTGILLVLGLLVLGMIIAGVVLNTTFLVREVRRNAQHDAFINAVTHELKTPVASIRLYLETLQTRAVDEPKRQEFYRTMLDDSDRLLGTIEQILRTGRTGQTKRALNISAIDFGDIVEECLARARRLYHVSGGQATYRSRAARHHSGRRRRSARRRVQPDRQRRQILRQSERAM